MGSQSWLRGLEKDIEVTKDFFVRAHRSTYWEWVGGSRLIFWRWTPEIQKEARDGTPVFVKGKYLVYTKR